MNITRSHIRVAAFASAIAVLLQVGPAMAERPATATSPSRSLSRNGSPGPCLSPTTLESLRGVVS